jgi:hypothetical protein
MKHRQALRGPTASRRSASFPLLHNRKQNAPPAALTRAGALERLLRGRRAVLLPRLALAAPAPAAAAAAPAAAPAAAAARRAAGARLLAGDALLAGLAAQPLHHLIAGDGHRGHGGAHRGRALAAGRRGLAALVRRARRRPAMLLLLLLAVAGVAAARGALAAAAAAGALAALVAGLLQADAVVAALDDADSAGPQVRQPLFQLLRPHEAQAGGDDGEQRPLVLRGIGAARAVGEGTGLRRQRLHRRIHQSAAWSRRCPRAPCSANPTPQALATPTPTLTHTSATHLVAGSERDRLQRLADTHLVRDQRAPAPLEPEAHALALKWQQRRRERRRHRREPCLDLGRRRSRRGGAAEGGERRRGHHTAAREQRRLGSRQDLRVRGGTAEALALWGRGSPRLGAHTRALPAAHPDSICKPCNPGQTPPRPPPA